MFTSPLVNLYTRDIERSVTFYGGVLGFTETFRTPTEGVPTHVELVLDGFTLGLGTVEAARSVHGVEATPGAPAMAVVVWCDDVETAYDRLIAAGAPGLIEPHDVGNGNRTALVRDPDGNLLEIVAKQT